MALMGVGGDRGKMDGLVATGETTKTTPLPFSIKVSKLTCGN